MTAPVSTLPRLDRELVKRIRDEGRDIAVPSDASLDYPEVAVQFGTGALLRGFVDDFLHRANQQGLFEGRVVAIASTGSSRDRALSEQDGLYTLVVEGIEKGERVEQRRVIGSLSRALSAVDEWSAVLELARSGELEWVFSNTTEIGIVDDNESAFSDAPPKSFPAKLTRFLFERAQACEYDAEYGLTVIPCELIEDNGARLKQIVLSLAARWDLDPQFVDWIEAAVPFVNTLVDRIVPGSPRDENVERLRDALGYEDAMLTCCEPYRLFAIEGDEGLRARMTWAQVDDGIIIAPDIAPYRKRKVHLLNGPHSLMACVGLAMGCVTVRDAITTPSIAAFVRRAMMDEIAPVLDVQGAGQFASDVLDRFANPFIKHALVDITLQATMKMKVRVVPVVARYIERNGAVPQALSFGFAAYLDHMRKRGANAPADAQAGKLSAYWAAAGSDADLVQAVGRDVELWGQDLCALRGFCEAVAGHLSRIRELGMEKALV